MEKVADLADRSVLFFFQLVLIFRLWTVKTMLVEYFDNILVNTRAISTIAYKNQWYQHQ